VIVGVQSELRVGVDFDRLDVAMLAGDKPYLSETLTTASKTNPIKFPAEFAFSDLPSDTSVSIKLDGKNGQFDVFSRLASTSVLKGRTTLLPIMIQSQCEIAPPGGVGGPECAAPQTCIGGACADSFVSPSKLKDYAPGWASSGDICKPSGGGAPVVTVGEGQSDYLPLADGDVAQVEAGPQGGHHVWIAVRMKNLRQSGSITSVTGYFPDLMITIAPFDVIFTYDQDEGGYCKLFGLRFQLDLSNNINTLLGHTMNVVVTVTDTDGSVGKGTKTVKLSNNIL
jgi:hypothetical protein